MDNEVTCSICLNILYRPVVLPCNHQFCRECITAAFDQTSYQCPMCRYRLSNWLRKVKDIDCAVNQNRQVELRNLFPEYYRDKDLGLSPRLSKAERRCLQNLKRDETRKPILSARGEIHSEYLAELQKAACLRAAEDKENEQASLALAFQLLAHEGFVADLDDTVIRNSVVSENPVGGKKQSSPIIQHACSSSHSTILHSTQVKITKERPKIRRHKTLLDYAVNTCANKPVPALEDPLKQVLCDEVFARKLQEKYLATPPASRSSKSKKARRTCR